MQIKQKKDNSNRIEFELDELELINRVLNVTLHAFGLDEVIKKTQIQKKEIEQTNNKIKSAIEENRLNIEFDSNELILLAKAFKEACEIIDENEMHTLTGYSWDQAMLLKKDLEKLNA